MRIAAFCIALSSLLLCGCAGGEVSGADRAGIDVTEPDRPIAD
jgi:hypothetical protein